MGKAGRFVLLLFVVSLILGPAVARAEMLDRIVAVVNNDIILYSELQQQVKMVKKLSPRLNNLDPQQEAQLERQVLEQMIQQKLTEQQVKKLQIEVSKHDVDQAIAGIEKENGLSGKQLEYMIHQQGKTMQDFRESIRKDMERSRLIERVFKSKTVITDQEVTQYLESSAGAEAQGKLHLALIFLPLNEGDGSQGDSAKKLAETIHEQLQGGAKFAALAKQYSQGPAAQEGGDIGYIPAGEMAPQIAAATRGVKVGGVTDPIKTAQGYYIVKVIDIERSSNPAVDNPKAREKARRELMQKAVDKEFKSWMKDLEARSFIQINL